MLPAIPQAPSSKPAFHSHGLTLLKHALGRNAADHGQRRSDCRVHVLPDEIDERRHGQNRSAGTGKTERTAYCGAVCEVESELRD